MGLFSIIADKIYGIGDKSSKANVLYKQWQTQTNKINTTGAHYKTLVTTAQEMQLYNYALMIIATQATFDDENYAKWEADNTLDKPIIPKQAEIASIYEDLAELTPVGPAIWKIGKTLKNKFFTNKAKEVGENADVELEEFEEPLNEEQGTESTRDLGTDEVGDNVSNSVRQSGEDAGLDTEATTEEGLEATGEAIEEATTAGLAELAGPAIVVALGIDAILSFVDTAKEAKKLDKEIYNLQTALNQVNAILDHISTNVSKVEGVIVKQQKLFLQNMKLLNKIQPATFDYQKDPSILGNSSFFHIAMGTAATQYKYVGMIRQNFNNAIKNMGKHFSWYSFTFYNVYPDAPPSLTKDQVTGMLNYAVKHSDAMAMAKAKG